MTKALTPKDVAETLGVSVRTIVDMLNRGEIPGRKLGKFWRIHPDVLEKLLPRGADESKVVSIRGAR